MLQGRGGPKIEATALGFFLHQMAGFVPETARANFNLPTDIDPTVAIAIADAGRAPPRFVGTINPLPSELCKALRRQRCRPESTVLVYEAGPCGYGWARHLNAHGWRCEVISPAHVVRTVAGRAIKTDRRDALLLARASRAGNLTPIALPNERDEAILQLEKRGSRFAPALHQVRLFDERNEVVVAQNGLGGPFSVWIRTR